MENNLPFNERIARILHDENFRRDCINGYRQNFFFKHLNLIKQIAFIDISQYRIDNHEFDATITEQDILDETLSFYADLDAICPSQPLLPTVLENQKYVTFKPNYGRLKPGEKPRSSCGFSWVKDEYGNDKLEREIFFDLEQNIKTRFVGPHEFAHSLSKAFSQFLSIFSSVISNLLLNPLIKLLISVTVCFISKMYICFFFKRIVFQSLKCYFYIFLIFENLQN